MVDRFATWKEAHTAAVHLARQLGKEVGLEKLPSPLDRGLDWRVFSLPRRENRFGFEARCEVVGPGDSL
jgi:hypothetical protein